MRRGVVLVVLVAVATACSAAPFRADGEPDGLPVDVADLGDRYVVTNDDGAWTVRTGCATGLRTTVGPGYISELVTHDGVRVVDDRRARGTLNDPEFGGLGAFGWHHARGRPGRLRFRGENAWEISGRVCAHRNGRFGVVRSEVAEPPRAAAPDAVELAVDVLFSDMFTYPRPLMRVRYRYRFERSVVKAWITLAPLCSRGRCGRTRSLAFVKEPKLVAHVTGGDYTRMATFSDAGALECIYVGGGARTGAILDTGQCGADGRTRLRFDFGSATSGAAGGCETGRCLNVVMRSFDDALAPGSPTDPWEDGERGLDGWAVSAAARPAAYRADTPSVDGVVWDCKGEDPAHPEVRRWETTGRKDRLGRYLSLGGLFPGWEGGRGGYDCEPLARAFGPSYERWGVFASYSLGKGWEELR